MWLSVEDEINERARASFGLMQAVKWPYIDALPGGIVEIAIALEKA